MLLTLLNWYASGGPIPPTFSTGNGVLCLTITVFSDVLTVTQPDQLTVSQPDNIDFQFGC